MELARAQEDLELKSACREPDLSLSGLEPVPLSKIGTHLLASLGSKGKDGGVATLVVILEGRTETAGDSERKTGGTCLISAGTHTR